MKKYCFYILSALVFSLTSCSNKEWSFDDFEYSTIYFSYQSPIRTLTLGEDIYDNTLDNQHKCKIMATVGGMYTNRNDVTLGITVDNSLTDGLFYDGTDQRVLPMPSSYYQLASNEIYVPKGQVAGGVEVQLTDAFFDDPNAINTTYVIPIRMTHVNNIDSILRGIPAEGVVNPRSAVRTDWDVLPRDYIMYAIKYINPWHATYLRRGVDVLLDRTNNANSKTVVRKNLYVEKDEVCAVRTVSMNQVSFASSIKDNDANDIAYELILSFDDSGNCVISSRNNNYTVTGAGKYVLKGDKNSWGGEDRNAIYLDYEVEFQNNLKLSTKDTLVVRDRGVIMQTFTPVLK